MKPPNPIQDSLKAHYTIWLSIVMCILTLSSCESHQLSTDTTFVNDINELKEAIANAAPGTQITMANGTWEDVQIKFYGDGTEDDPITLKAETPGKVFIEGRSSLQLGGNYLVVDGLYFRNGHSPSESIISYRINEDSIAFHSTVTNCVIKDFSKSSRLTNDSWIELFGRHNSLDHCYISGKSNDGETLRVLLNGNQHIKNHHQITFNYFGPRPRKGGPRAETIRIGDSKTSVSPGYVNVSDNYFEACNGEVEVISDKTTFNTFANNIFYKCEGSLVLRHASHTTVDGNIFIGDDDSEFYGGIRVINTGHWITNNYFYKIKGYEFRSPLAIMNGIPKSQLNRYKQVTDVVVAHNTWVDCKSPFQVGVGQNKSSAGVLPAVEIRSAPPIRTIIANNLIYNHTADDTPVINHDDISGVSFYNNVIDNNEAHVDTLGSLNHQKLEMTKINDWLYTPSDGQSEVLHDRYAGFDFENITNDLFGSPRNEEHSIGAITDLASAERYELDKSRYGPSWYSPSDNARKGSILKVSSADGDLSDKLKEAQNGDIIELSDASYTLNSPLIIDKDITIRSNTQNKIELSYKGSPRTAAFELHPNGAIRLENISLQGQGTQHAFAPLSENMSSAYKIFVDRSSIKNFDYVLEASKGSFADSINMTLTTLINCKNGLVLAADARGDYNAEMVSFDNCTFDNIHQNVIHFYRGGYDESTIGGYLTINNSTFTRCGQSEKSGTLLKTRGIINVQIHDNTFQNNPVQKVAVLWGIKNNHHSNNTFSKSGQLLVEDEQKLDLLY